MHGRGTLALACAIAIASAACFLSIDPLPAEPSSSADAASSDGAPIGTDGMVEAATEAGGEAAAPDGGTEAATPCAAAHVFCADFDGTSLVDGFAYAETKDAGGASLALDSAWWLSPPHAARVRLDAFSTGGSRYARVGTDKLPHMRNRIHYAFDVRFEKMDTNSGDNSFQVDLLALSAGSSTYELATVIEGSGGRMTEYANNTDYDGHGANSASFKAGQWSHVELAVGLGPAPTLEYTVDDVTILSKRSFKFAFDATEVALSFATGLEYAPGPMLHPVDYSIDNVVIDGD